MLLENTAKKLIIGFIYVSRANFLSSQYKVWSVDLHRVSHRVLNLYNLSVFGRRCVDLRLQLVSEHVAD